MADPLLSVFPPALLRLILCGGEGLSAAWGPLILIDEPALLYPWDPSEEVVHPATGYGCDAPLDQPDRWRFPLKHWRQRLALVAAHLVQQWAATPRMDDEPEWAGQHRWAPFYARISASDHYQLLHILRPAPDEDGEDFDVWDWSVQTGWGASSLRLPTLPVHLLTHDPAIALLLALYDVPEIRARLATG